MEEKKSFSERVEHFLAGKGFYIVLFVCVAIIGASAWALFFSDVSIIGNDDEDYVNTMADADQMPVISYDPDTSKETGEKDDTDKAQEPSDETAKVTEPEKPETSKSEPNQPVKENTDNANNAKEAPEESGNNETKQPTTFMWPVAGSISMAYSDDALVFSKTMSDWRTHTGIDLEAQMGTKVMAIAEGQVEKVYDDDMYGTTVIIDHGDGLKSIYCNLAATPTVKEGDAVTMGSVIGSVGDTALCEIGEVAHLHFAMTKDDKNIDPAEILPEKR